MLLIRIDFVLRKNSRRLGVLRLELCLLAILAGPQSCSREGFWIQFHVEAAEPRNESEMIEYIGQEVREEIDALCLPEALPKSRVGQEAVQSDPRTRCWAVSGSHGK